MPVNTNRWNRVRYTLYAPFYDLAARRLGRGRHRAVELLDVQPEERVLIDGCGTGLDLELLPRGCQITAIDLTPAMVEKTQARAAALGHSIDARVMDAAALDFVDESFDCVILHLILAVVPDPHATAREAARVLRRGGRAAIFDKFAADRASLGRRALNVVTNFVATDNHPAARRRPRGDGPAHRSRGGVRVRGRVSNRDRDTCVPRLKPGAIF